MPYVCVRASEIDDSDLLRFLCSPCTRKRGFLERKGRRPCHRVSREMRRTCIACAPILIYGLRHPCGLHGSDVQNNIQVAENPLGFVKEVPRPVPIFFPRHFISLPSSCFRSSHSVCHAEFTPFGVVGPLSAARSACPIFFFCTACASVCPPLQHGSGHLGLCMYTYI